MADSERRTAQEREAARRERERERLPAHQNELPAYEHELPGEDGYEDGDAAVTDEHEVASGTRRMSRLSRIGAPRPARTAREGTRKSRTHRPRSAKPRTTNRRAPKPHSPGRAHAPHSRAGRIFSLLALAVAAALIWFLVELFQPFHGSGHGEVTVTIPPNSSSTQVGDVLSQDGVIASSFFFALRATLAGDRGDLRAGTYHLGQDMSYGEVLKVLTTPPPAAKVSNLTITEGRTREQVDTLLRAESIHGSYLAQTRHSPLLDPLAYGAPRDTPSLEGFLFPSTYQLRDPIRISDLVADQLQTFKRQFATVNLGYARGKHLSPYDVLMVASMVQAESGTAHDAPLVASVIYNRLTLGIPLQIDATTRYATGNYTRPLTQSELSSASPYNTRIHTGLPPTPISSPGLASIQAAAHPGRTNYLYFVVKPCGNGSQAFFSSYSQFLSAVAQYDNARARNGGRSPSHC